MKTVLVVCGSGIATSTVIGGRVKQLAAENGIQVNTIQCSVGDISSYLGQADFIVSTMQLGDKYAIPVISAVSFLTGVGDEETEELIINALKEGA